MIGYGSPNKADTHGAHGEPLGADEIALTRQAIGWSSAPFEIPAEVHAAWDARARGAQAQANWEATYASYAAAHPELAAEFTRRVKGELPARWRASTALGSASTCRRPSSTLRVSSPSSASDR